MLPGAKVTVINSGTNQRLVLTTSAEGAYTAGQLEPALYRVTVEMRGFKRSEINNVNAESGGLGHVIDERQIVDTPLNNRSVLDLALTVPNVSGETGTEDPAVTMGVPNPGAGLIVNGAVINVPRGSLLTAFPGFNAVDLQLQASVSSIRHAGYVNVQRRFSKGLALTANTLPSAIVRKSISAERAVSTFGARHSFASTFQYELPFGKGQRWLRHAPGVLDTLAGGWRITGVGCIVGGPSFVAFLTDNNRLGSGRRGVRPNVVPGVSLYNPLYDRKCPIGALCQPYFNPAAFVRPAKGELGNAPRTFDGARTPTREYLDLSLQKDFRLAKDKTRKLQLRVDFINVFDHPNFITGNNGLKLYRLKQTYNPTFGTLGA